MVANFGRLADTTMSRDSHLYASTGLTIHSAFIHVAVVAHHLEIIGKWREERAVDKILVGFNPNVVDIITREYVFTYCRARNPWRVYNIHK